jgi:glycosyltransferase involved in cell wall biosynthesis
VNIWREVEADGAGFVASDTVAGTVSSLRRWLELEPSLAAAMRTQAGQTFDRRFTVEAMSKDLLRVLQAGARESGTTVGKRPLTA